MVLRSPWFCRFHYNKGKINLTHASQVVGPGIESGATIVEEIVHLFWKVDVAQRKMHAMQSNPWQISGSGRAVSTKQENHLQQLKRRNAYVVTAQII